MIRLKNGHEIAYKKDFDLFFKNLLESIITESKTAIDNDFKKEISGLDPRDRLLEEIMDNCIFVTHQLFELADKHEELSKFIVTGFLFNSLVLVLQDVDVGSMTEGPERSDPIH